MYYVVHSLSDLSRATIHLGTHAHHVFEGKCNEYFKEMKIMVTKEVLCTPNSISFVISLAVSKTFLSHHLFNEDGEVHVELLKGEKLNQAMLMFVPLCFPNIRNLISSIKHCPGNMAPFIPSLCSSPRIFMITFKTIIFMGYSIVKKFIFSKCQLKGMLWSQFSQADATWG
jgi:hypothetical protein